MTHAAHQKRTRTSHTYSTTLGEIISKVSHNTPNEQVCGQVLTHLFQTGKIIPQGRLIGYKLAFLPSASQPVPSAPTWSARPQQSR